MENSQNMTIQYYERAEETREAHPDCDTQAVLGDLVYGKVPTAEIPDDSLPFDLVTMRVSLNSFVRLLKSSDPA